MPRQKSTETPKQHITRTIYLDMLHAGADLTLQVRDGKDIAYEPGSELWDKYFPSSIERYTRRLRKRGMIELQGDGEGQRVVLTEKGRTQILTFDITALSIPAQIPWDGKWRVVLFDIPAEVARMRFKLLECLKSMGFRKLQNSIYVHPYPCDRELVYLRETLGLPHALRLAVIERIEGEEELRREFNLQ